jgi:2-methylcitrate dehydratase PrpD
MNRDNFYMTAIQGKDIQRRSFLRALSIAAGTASFAPTLCSAHSLLQVSADTKPAPAGTGQTVKLAEYAAKLRYEEIPPDILQRAKDCMADTVATILFGASFPWSQMIIAQARMLGRGGKSAIIGTGTSVSAPAAALAHGAMTHAFEQDNITFPDSGAHPGAALVTSGFAVAQDLGSSGRDVLAALVAGAEVIIRIGLATKRTNEARGFHAPGSVNPFGSAIVTGRLLKLDAAKMTNAMGIAGSTSGGLLEFARSNNGAMVKRLHLGRAAEGGVLAGNLAAAGFTGPDTVLEGGLGFLHAFCNQSDPSELTRGLGEIYQTRTITMKHFSCHITAHTSVEAMLDLRKKYAFSGGDIASIKIEGSKRMATANNIPVPNDIMLAQFSIPFCVSLAAYRNPVDPYSFDDSATRDPGILATASVVEITALPAQGDEDITSSLTVVLKDGRHLTSRVTEFLGTPARPLTGDDLRQKFLLLTKKYPAKHMEEIFQRIQHIEGEANLDWLRV